MDQTQNRRKREDVMKEEMTTRRTGYSRSSSRTHRHHSPPNLTRKFYASEDSISSPELSHVRH
jgi:hypothetical protein